MGQRLQVRVAAGEAMRALSRNFVVFVLPVAVVVFGDRGCMVVLHAMWGRSFLWLELLMLLVVSCPLNLFAEAVVSAMYLRQMSGSVGSLLKQVAEVGAYRGLASLIARLILRVALWGVVAILIFFLGYMVLLLPVGILHRGFHVGPGVHGFLHHKGGNRLGIVVIVGIYSGILSRYSFVMPMLVLDKNDDMDVIFRALHLAKKHWLPLWTVSVLGALFLMGMHYEVLFISKIFPVPHSAYRVLSAVNLSISTVVTTWYFLLKTVLMLQARETQE